MNYNPTGKLISSTVVYFAIATDFTWVPQIILSKVVLYMPMVYAYGICSDQLLFRILFTTLQICFIS